MRTPLRAGTGLYCAVALVPSALAVTATGLSSFDGLEEPLVCYHPGTRVFAPDDYVNIVDESGGAFRMHVRYHSDWWDGDRDTLNRDRQRAEVKGLGPHQKNGDTFEYATTWRTDPDFHGTNRFCHLFQLKSTDGDSGAPLITLSIEAAPHRAAVRYWSGNAGKAVVAREFDYRPGVWSSVRIRVKTSRAADGEVLVSVNGDEFRGVRAVPLFRPAATEYRPKWGLYRGVTAGMDLSDDYVEHRNISAEQVGAPAIDNGALEEAARAQAAVSIDGALAGLMNRPPSAARKQAIGAIAALWSGADAPAAIGWAQDVKEPDLRADAIARIYGRWELQDFDAAMKWLKIHAPNPELDSLLWYQATDTTLRYVRRPAALACAGLMSDPAWRDRAYAEIILIWARPPEGRAAALAYAETEPKISAAEKAALAAAIGALPPGARPGE
jgi:hypothetical protein